MGKRPWGKKESELSEEVREYYFDWASQREEESSVWTDCVSKKDQMAQILIDLVWSLSVGDRKQLKHFKEKSEVIGFIFVWPDVCVFYTVKRMLNIKFVILTIFKCTVQKC